MISTVAGIHLDQLLPLLLFAIAVLFQLLTKAASKANKNADGAEPRSSSPTTQPPGRPPVNTDEERIRRFLEALGQPTSSKPPPAVAPRPSYQKRVVLPHVPPFAPPHPPLITRPPEISVRKAKSPPPIAMPPAEVQPPKPAVAEAPVFEVQGEAPMAEVSSPAPAIAPMDSQIAVEPRGGTIAELLRSPSGLRDAIVLREIFDAPRGLRAFDFGGSA